MILRSSPPSPFGRKIKLAAAILGLSGRIEVVVADTNDAADPLRGQNPLGKIPTLITDEGESLYDSRVILEYLDQLAGGGRIIPAGGPERFAVLRLQALADGMMDAGILQVYEKRWREEDKRDARWVGYQAEKIARALALLEADVASLGERLDVGTIAVACALGYLDLRFEGAWRASHPGLVAWLDGFSARVPAFEATRAS